MLQLDLGGFAIVAGQQRQVQVIVIARALRAARARRASIPCGPVPGCWISLGEQRQVGVAEAIDVFSACRAGRPALQRLRDEIRIGAAAERFAVERVGDAERVC